jgi:multisubunit Na+/H+ antiporter MnhG subunit
VTAAGMISGALLAAGVLAVLLSCLGILLVRDAYDKLHYAAPANTIAPVAIAAAVVVRDGLGQLGIKALVVAAVLVSTNAALTHATARAARIHQYGRWTVAPEAGEATDAAGPPAGPPGEIGRG